MKLPGNTGRPILILLILLALVTYFAGLFPDVTRDASKYASIARGIYDTGDFINLKIHGEPYLQKPPMLFWLSALSFYLFGLSNFAFKLPLLLIAFLGLYSVYRLAKSLYNKQTGLIAAVLMGSSQIYFLFTMDIHTDTVLQPFVTFALWQLWDFLKTRRNFNFVLGFIGIGLAMLTKGPVGAVVPMFAVLGHLLFTGQFKRLSDIRWYLGIIIAAITILPALAGLFNQFGFEGIKFYFWTNNFERVTGSSSGGNVLYYVYNLLWLLFPWMILLFCSIFFEFRSLIKRRFKAREFFVFSGIWFFFVILSFSKSQLPNYIFILIPLFAILTAKYISIAINRNNQLLYKLFSKIQHFVSGILVFLLLLIVFWVFPIRGVWLWLLVVGMATIAVYIFFAVKSKTGKLLYPTLMLMISFNLVVNLHVAPQLLGAQASVKAAAIFNVNAGANEHMYNYNYPSHELYFYCKIPVIQIINDVTLFELLSKPGTWVLTTGEIVERIKTQTTLLPEIFPLKHLWTNKLRIQYFNPKTRDQSFDTLYLLHSKP